MHEIDVLYTAAMWWLAIGWLTSVLTAPFRKRWCNDPGLHPLIIPAAMLAIKGIADFLGNKSKADAEKAARVMYNEWLQDRSLTAADIAQNLLDRGIDIYGNQITTTSATGTSAGTSQSTNRSQGTSTSTSAPVVDPNQAMIKAWLEGSIAGMPEQLSEGEKLRVVGGLADSARKAKVPISNAAARMNLGVGTSLQSALLSNPVDNAFNLAKVNYLGKEVPELNRNFLATKQAAASGVLDAWKRRDEKTTSDLFGSTSGSNTGTFANTGTTTTPPNYSSLLNFLAPPAPGTDPNQTGFAPGPNAISDNAGSLAQMLLWLNQKGQQGTPDPKFGRG